jgi:hypothetical protein
MQKESSSFRDRSGFIFYEGDSVFRAILPGYKKSYDTFMASGLYQALADKKLLLSHKEISSSDLQPADVYKTLHVPRIPFISYPFEWCFTQLKEAALLTLEIQKTALEYGMSLKDASAFNVQFYNGAPVFIDTLSFEPYEEGKPWVAYRQFCNHFLAPLSLIAKVDPEFRKLSQLYIDGIPLNVASSALPYKTRFSPFYQMHIHYHAKMEMKYSADTEASSKVKLKLSKNKLIAIISHLESGIRSMSLPVNKTEWSDYYNEFSYSDESIAHKKSLVKEWATLVKPVNTWDLGCNTGMFSEIVQNISANVVSFDIDHLAIEKLYAYTKKKDSKNLLPLVMDLSNPSPAIGWANRERMSFTERAPADLILALALIHHISISNNVPFHDVAAYFSSITSSLIIEFVPKSDPQAQRLLVTREDIFHDYDKSSFEASFAKYFFIEKAENIQGTERVLYLMKKR